MFCPEEKGWNVPAQGLRPTRAILFGNLAPKVPQEDQMARVWLQFDVPSMEIGPFIVDLPIINAYKWWFSIVMFVYQRVILHVLDLFIRKNGSKHNMMAFSVQLLRVSACLGGLGVCKVMSMLSLPIFLKIRNSDDIYIYIEIYIYIYIHMYI